MRFARSLGDIRVTRISELAGGIFWGVTSAHTLHLRPKVEETGR